MSINISDVFKTIGKPTITYVERRSGQYEQALKENLYVAGKICLITGPSKTGKSTLYQKVLDEIKKQPLIVRCDDQMKTEDVWRKALEDVNFEILSSKTNSNSLEVDSGVKASLSLGWSWLGQLISGELSLGIKNESTETEIKERVLSKPSSKHIIPVLKTLPYILVIEDFHYLSEDVKISLFQQIKAFVDQEVSIIILGTTHHAVDLAYSNKDLVGRITHIEVGTWETSDLEKIIKQGFNYLNIEFPSSLLKLISKESVGLPLITQSICYKLFAAKELLTIKSSKVQNIQFKKDDLIESMHRVAVNDFNVFNDVYEILIAGFRKGARKYNTYELLLLIFTIDPIKFKLTRFEIDQRLSQLKDKFAPPPTPSINSTLGALGKLQKKNNFELLEWATKQNTLYILEPSFLFFLRWREIKIDTADETNLIDYFSKIFRNRRAVDINQKTLFDL